jgi:hypothetical protein
MGILTYVVLKLRNNTVMFSWKTGALLSSL